MVGGEYSGQVISGAGLLSKNYYGPQSEKGGHNVESREHE